jgi:hypothetical protein
MTTLSIQTGFEVLNSSNPYVATYIGDSLNPIASPDLQTVLRRERDIIAHYYFPVTRQRTMQENWIQSSQELLSGSRAFTKEEAEIHKQGLLKLFKPTGRNLFDL